MYEDAPLSNCADAMSFAHHGERALAGGHALESLEIAAEGLEWWPNNKELLRIQARALTKSGVPEQANRVLTELFEAGDRHPETLGNLARTHKDFGLTADNSAERERQLRKSVQYYEMAFANSGTDYWNGINVATLATLLGETAKATEVARTVRKQCQQEWDAGQGDRYWLAATLGEAELNLGNLSEAVRWYREAAAVSCQRYGDLSRTRCQARLLLQHCGQQTKWIDEALPVPRVAVFVGHMCDQPGRRVPRFPEQLVPHVRNAIRDLVKKHNALIGFSSAACGSDILFLETLLDLQGEPHVVLPYEKNQFVRDSVDIVPSWKQRFDEVIKQIMVADARQSRVTEVAAERMEFASVSYDYANLVLHGLATERAKELDTELVQLAVWNGQAGDGLGGTASVVERWRASGLVYDHIDLAKMLLKECPNPLAEIASSTPTGAVALRPPGPETKILALMFADAVGFSKFTEKAAVNFAKHCLSIICRFLLDWPHEAIVRESRGDGVYVAFETVRDAGLFALGLQEKLANTNWVEMDLPANLSLRIGLHAGPVCRCFDPILGAQTWTGAHVSRAARFGQSGQPGQVSASQQFAAMAAVEKVTEFTCTYAGTRELHKQYGAFPIYAVRRARL